MEQVSRSRGHAPMVFFLGSSHVPIDMDVFPPGGLKKAAAAMPALADVPVQQAETRNVILFAEPGTAPTPFLIALLVSLVVDAIGATFLVVGWVVLILIVRGVLPVTA